MSVRSDQLKPKQLCGGTALLSTILRRDGYTETSLRTKRGVSGTDEFSNLRPTDGGEGGDRHRRDEDTETGETKNISSDHGCHSAAAHSRHPQAAHQANAATAVQAATSDSDTMSNS